MESWIAIAILVLLAPAIIAIVAAVQVGKIRSVVEELTRRVRALELREVVEAPRSERKTSTATTEPPPIPASLLAAAPPPLPSPPAKPPPPPSRVPQPNVSAKSPSINWESFLGVKLFAWVGGLALFLGVVFFIKYAFDRNLITPSMRISIGAICGVALIVTGALPALRRYRVPAQSLCAVGILCLYASAYCAWALYNLIPLAVATGAAWVVTGFALFLTTWLDAQAIAWLALIGGFISPFLLQIPYRPPDNQWPTFGPFIFVFSYMAVLDCAVAFVSWSKRWTILLAGGAVGSLVVAFAWGGDVFYPSFGYVTQHYFFVLVEVLFLGLCTAVAWPRSPDKWLIIATGIAGVGALLGVEHTRGIMNHVDLLPWMLVVGGGILGFVTIHRRFDERTRAMATLTWLAVFFTCLFELQWCKDVIWYHVTPRNFLDGDPAAMFAADHLWLTVFRHGAIFLLYAATPYLIGTKRLWPWLIAAVAGLVHFGFIYAYARSGDLISYSFMWLLPLAFTLPPAFGVWYLLRREGVTLISADSRLASQSAAVLAFVSLIFPVQFDREWITLGWAVEGFALVLLFWWLPNRRLRAVALILFAAAFVRLALNPAVLEYHRRTGVPILNWYFYAYGVAAMCLFFGARWFGEPRDRSYERLAPAFLYTLAGIVCFLLMNIEIADYFSIGPTLTFSFAGNFARDMTYTIAWAGFAFALLLLGIFKNTRAVRLAAIGLLCCALGKLFLHDLDALSQLYRIGAFFAVAVIAIVASFLYQRFLAPKAQPN